MADRCVCRIIMLLIVCAVASPAAAQSLAVADSLLARGDTSGALAVYERLTRRNWRDAEAHWRAGLLYMTRHEPGAQLSAARRSAEEHFRYATRAEPDSAKYLLALASLFRGEDWSLTRMQVDGLVERARLAAEGAADTALLVEAETRAGRVAFERWEHFGNRWTTGPSGLRPQEAAVHGDWRYVEEFFSLSAQPVGGSGEGPARDAETHFRRAVALAPGHLEAAGRLVVLLGATGRWSEALEVARGARQAAPDQGAAWALLGLVHARLDRWREAEAAFAGAFARMDSVARAPYDDLTGLLKTGDRAAVAQLSPAERARTTALYWELSQPLMLTEAHETRTEYYARITYSRLRWSDPELGLDGARTHRGAVYVRFGPPDIEAVFDRSQVVWLYWASRLRFMFRLTPGFANARFNAISQEAFEQAERAAPAQFDNVPLVGTLDTIVTQVAQFRGTRGRTDLAVFGWLPLDRMVGGVEVATLAFRSAAIVRNDGGEVQRIVREETVDPASVAAGQHRTWRLALAPGPFLLRLEAHAPTLNQGARHSGIIDVRPYGGTGFDLSDLLVARRLAPRDSAPARWTDFFIEPSAGHAEPGEVVSLLWEQYNLAPGRDGIARWHVELRVTVAAIERRDFMARIVGGVGDAIGASALGDDRIALAWDREEAVAPGGTVPEWVTLDFGDAPAGSYTITLVVTDRVRGTTVERTRTLVRSTADVQR